MNADNAGLAYLRPLCLVLIGNPGHKKKAGFNNPALGIVIKASIEVKYTILITRCKRNKSEYLV